MPVEGISIEVRWEYNMPIIGVGPVVGAFDKRHGPRAWDNQPLMERRA